MGNESTRYDGEMDAPDFPLNMGAAWLDLAATLRGRYRGRRIDLLDGPGAVASWLAAEGLAPMRHPARADVEAAQMLREALHALARAQIEHRGPSADAVATLNTVLAGDQAVRVKAAPGSIRAESPPTAAAALARLARQAAEDLTGPRRDRLRACGDQTCSGIFLDDTGRRRWCADQRCGVRTRVRAHRARASNPSSGQSLRP